MTQQRFENMESSMEKLDRDSDGSSLNIVQDNIDKLKTLFPDIFSEGKIDFDKLRETLGDRLETDEERYNFTWHGKSAAPASPKHHQLAPCARARMKAKTGTRPKTCFLKAIIWKS